MATLQLKLIAPDGVKYSHEATSVTLATPTGEITILPNHMPLISLVSAGEIVLRNGKEIHHLVTEGGILEIQHNELKILADTAEEADSLDAIKIEEAQRRARQLLSQAKGEQEYTEAMALLEKQIAKLNVIKRRRNKYK